MASAVHGRRSKRAAGAVALRARSDVRRRWPTLVVLALLLGGLAGGLMAAASAARRTASAYPRLLAGANTGDAIVAAEDQATLARLASDPAVSDAVFAVSLHGGLTSEDGTVIQGCESGGEEIAVIASPDPRLGTEVHRLQILAGRTADPTNPDEVVVTRDVASRAGLSVGDRIAAQLGPFCSSDPGPQLRTTFTVVGVALEPWGVRAEHGVTLRSIFATPALAARAEARGIERSPGALLFFRDGAGLSDLGAASGVEVVWTAAEHATQIDDGLDADVTSLRLVAALGAVGGLLVLLPVVVRAERRLVADRDALRAIGLTDRDLGRLGIVHGLLVGVGALAVAVVLSGLVSGFTPVAEARAVEPHPGLRLDLAVVLMGAGFLLILLPVMTGLVGRTAPAARSLPRRTSLTSRWAAGGWLSPVGSSGFRLAYEDRSGPARSLGYYLAEVVAVATVVAGLTFGAGLARLQETPRLVGWNWDLAVFSDVRAGEVTDFLRAQPEVTRASAGTFWSPQVALGPDRIRTWVVTFGTGPNSVGGTLISGRAATGPEEVVVHPRLLERLGASIGDSVDLTLIPDSEAAEPVTAPVIIVGTGVLPLDATSFEASVAMTFEGLARLSPGLRPHMVTADLADAADAAEVRDRILASGMVGGDDVWWVDGDQPAAEIGGLEVTGVERVPETLGGLMAVLGAAVLAYLVVDRVREGRRDLAIQRALGFTQRDVRRTVAFASSAMTLGVLLVGVPVGLLAGCQAWLAYADRLGVKPEAAIGWEAVVFVVVAALVVANLAAIVPGRLASRQRPAALLRAE